MNCLFLLYDAHDGYSLKPLTHPHTVSQEYRRSCQSGCCACCTKSSSSQGHKESNHYSVMDGHVGSDTYLPFPDISEVNYIVE